MTKHTARTARTMKKYLAASGLALGLAGIGLLASPGTAAADGHGVQNPDGTFGATDGASQSRHIPYDQPHGVDMVEAVFSYVTSSYPAGGSYPAEPVNNRHQSPMAGPSWPAASSWAEGDWGVDEHG